MSFRYYLGYIPKKTIKEMESLTSEELSAKMGKEDCFRPYDVAKEIYGLGSEFDDKILEKHIKNIFKKHETHINHSYGENYFYKLSNEGFKVIILHYHNIILEGYKKDMLRFHSSDLYEREMLKRSMESKIQEWSETEKGYFPYNLEDTLDLTKESSLVNSWKYEYAIFELVLKFKTFNWKKNQLVIYGY